MLTMGLRVNRVLAVCKTNTTPNSMLKTEFLRLDLKSVVTYVIYMNRMTCSLPFTAHLWRSLVPEDRDDLLSRRSMATT